MATDIAVTLIIGDNKYDVWFDGHLSAPMSDEV